MEDKRYLFEKMSVPKALATLALPTIISQIITMVYNLADTVFIGMSNTNYMFDDFSMPVSDWHYGNNIAGGDPLW